jgi:hypothetical protein
MPTTNIFPAIEASGSKERKTLRDMQRSAYRSAGFETLLRNHGIRDGRGLFKAISGRSGAEELVKTSMDGFISFLDTAARRVRAISPGPCATFRS